MEATKLPIRHMNTGPLKLTHPTLWKGNIIDCWSGLVGCDTVDGSEIPNNHLGWLKHVITSKENGINYHDWWCRILSINSMLVPRSGPFTPNPSIRIATLRGPIKLTDASRASDATCEMQHIQHMGPLPNPRGGFPPMPNSNEPQKKHLLVGGFNPSEKY